MIKNFTAAFLIVFSLITGLQVRAGAPVSWSTAFNSTKSFVENKSQFNDRDRLKDSQILFGAEDNGVKIYFTKSGLTYRFDKREKVEVDEAEERERKGESNEREEEEHAVKISTDLIHLQWLNANPGVELTAVEETPDYYTYHLAGQNLTARAYRKLVYKNLYAGIDVEYTFHPEQGIKYALIVHPGADASQIKIKWTGADKVSADRTGNVHVKTMFGDIVDHAPVTFYQSETPSSQPTTRLTVGQAHNPKPQTTIPSNFVKSGSIISFELGNYDRTQAIVIDPWTVSPGFNSSNKAWEIETDASGFVYVYGGEMPLRLKKYSAGGVIQWTYNTPYDTVGSWIGTLRTDPLGTSYITAGSIGDITKVNINGAWVWQNGPGGFAGDEYWAMTFNCDYTQLLVGGTKGTIFPPSGVGQVFNMNLNNGAVLNSVKVANTIPAFIINDFNEVRSMCSSPNGKIYFNTLDTIGELTPALTINWRLLTSYRYQYSSPFYGYTPQPQNVIRASLNYLYTMDGGNIYRRDLTNGAVINSVAIPGGGFASGGFGVVGINPYNNGIDIDSCGNVYVGSQAQVHKFDAALNLLSSSNTPGPVYDVSVNNNGEVLACGQGYVTSVNMSACGQVKAICVTSSQPTVSVTNTNPLCAGQCTGTGTANPSGGTAPYTYLWSNSQTTKIATGLCAGTYGVTVTDAASGTASSTITVIGATAFSTTPSSAPVSCNGLSDGTAGVVVTGGSPGYSYSWDNGKTTANMNNLSAGTYTVTITDSKGCTTTTTAVVSEPPPIVLNFQRAYYICGEAGGTVQLTASGGTSYSWTPGETLDDSLSSGPLANPFLPVTNYVVYVTNGACTDTAHVSITIVPSPSPPVVNRVVLGIGDSLWVSQGYIHYQWYFEGSPLPGDTLFYLIAKNTGHYSVYVTDSLGCNVITAGILVTVGIPEYMSDHGIKIFPNPAGNWFEILGLKLERNTIEVYDAVGKQIYSEEFSGKQKRINCAWSPGVYFVKITDDRKNYIAKLIIQ